MAPYYDSNSASIQMLEEKAKQDLWNNLSEKQRQKHYFDAASSLPMNTTQTCMLNQTPRTMPNSIDMMHFSSIDFSAMGRTVSAPLLGYADAPEVHDLQRSTSANTTWNTTPQDYTNDYTYSSSAATRRPSCLEPIPEFSTYSADNLVELSPTEYVTSHIAPSSNLFPSSSLPTYSQQHMQLTTGMPWSSLSDGSASPSTSSTALTTPITLSSNAMSRQSSCNPTFLDSSSMSRVQSDSSYMVSFPSGDEHFSLPLNNCVDVSFSHFTDGNPISENFLSVTQPQSTSVQAFVPSGNIKSYLAEDMRRSTSTTSSEGNASDVFSTSSNCSRSSRRQSEINAQASRKIAPKTIECDDETSSLPSNVSMARIRSEDGSSKTVGVITKTPYVRPQHPKIMCRHCDERPDGFRGTHELDRHIARAHATTRKGYICFDFSADKKFLTNCKHCRNKKVYGAYYNAAAHLRRAHFHPRKRGRKGKSDEKRGGIGGGDDPPMEWLKANWIQEVEVDNKPARKFMRSPSSASDDEADQSIDTAYEVEYESEPYSTQQSMSTQLAPQMHVHNDSIQYDAYGTSMHSSEPMMYDSNTVVTYDHMHATKDFSQFQFDAYMP